LLYGIGPREIQILCDDPWYGGKGKSLEEVSAMSLDQVFMLLTDRKNLRGIRGRVKTDSTVGVSTLANGDGLISGIAADGTKMKAKIVGKSLASRLREEQEQKEKREKKGRRRRKHGS
jgi:hypothetical protein